MSAPHALRLVPDGAHLVAAPGCGAPTTLLAALPDACPGWGWTLGRGILLGPLAFLPAVASGDLRVRTWHVPPAARTLVAAGLIDDVPLRASRVAAYLTAWRVDAALVRVSPPDRAGNVSLGGSVGYGLDALRTARTCLAEVDPAVPWTSGESTVPLSLFDAVVDGDQPMAQYRAGPPDATSGVIARHVLGLVPRDPVLQIGIGGVPESVLAGLAEADLGRVRFEGMGTDAMVDLFESGVLDPAGHVPGPALRSPELMGTARWMAFAHENPAIGLYPSSSSHDARRLGGPDRLVSVNAAIEVAVLPTRGRGADRNRNVVRPVAASSASTTPSSSGTPCSRSSSRCTGKLVPGAEGCTSTAGLSEPTSATSRSASQAAADRSMPGSASK